MTDNDKTMIVAEIVKILNAVTNKEATIPNVIGELQVLQSRLAWVYAGRKKDD